MHALLLARENVLLGEISAARKADIAAASAVSAGTTDVSDFKDLASHQERTELRDAELQRDMSELEDVREALARFNGGTYGICLDCAEPLDLQRLKVIPAAARCVTCQTKFESHSV